MKTPAIITGFILSAFITPAIAADAGTAAPESVVNYFNYAAVTLVLLLFIAVILILLRMIVVLSRVVLKNAGDTELPVIKKVRPAFFKFNTNANWFMILLLPMLGLIVLYFGVDYYSSVTENQTSDQYTASPGKVVVKAAAGNVITENTVTLNTTAAVLDSGKAVFDLHCSVCHGDKGQGIVGPNLTDDYWLHGGKIGDIFKTISLGVGANGMPEWDKQLSNQQISDVTNFVESLHGTNPAGAKAAQGTK